MRKNFEENVPTLIGLAIRAEIDSNQVYSDLSSRLKNPLLKEKFRMLAHEEEKHKQILENLAEKLFPEESLEIPEKTDENLIPSIIIKADTSLVDILNQAMKAEEAAEKFYAEFALKTKDSTRSILEYLSQIEHSHFLMLKSEYSLAQEFADYGEKDIDKVVT